MDKTTERELVQVLEYAEDRLDEAENAIWTGRPERCHGEIEQSLDELTTELWSIQSRIAEIKATVRNNS